MFLRSFGKLSADMSGIFSSYKVLKTPFYFISFCRTRRSCQRQWAIVSKWWLWRADRFALRRSNGSVSWVQSPWPGSNGEGQCGDWLWGLSETCLSETQNSQLFPYAFTGCSLNLQRRFLVLKRYMFSSSGKGQYVCLFSDHIVTTAL